MPRFPSSTSAPPSAVQAEETAMKSVDRLLSTACARLAEKVRSPMVKTAPLRELQIWVSPRERSCACLDGRPAVPETCAPIQCA